MCDTDPAVIRGTGGHLVAGRERATPRLTNRANTCRRRKRGAEQINEPCGSSKSAGFSNLGHEQILEPEQIRRSRLNGGFA
jgi:hypothetical protein